MSENNQNQEDTKAPVENQAASNEPAISSENEINWQKFREERAAERKALEEEKKRSAQKAEEAAALKRALEEIVNQQKYPQPSYSPEEEESEEDRLNKLLEKKLAERERENERKRQEQERAQIPIKVREKYRDFDVIVSQENLDRLRFDYPAIYESFKQTPDSMEKYDGVYQVVKKLVPNADSRKDERRLENNLHKPQSMSVPGVAKTSDTAPHIFSEEKRRANWEAMQKRMKGL